MRKKIELFISKRATTQIEMMRLVTFLVGTLMAVVGAFLHPFIGIRDSLYGSLTIGMSCSALLWLVVYLSGKLPLAKCATASVICSQLIISASIVILAITAHKGCEVAIINNEIISFSVLLVSCLCMLKKGTISVSLIFIVGISTAYLVNPSAVVPRVMNLFVFKELFLLLYTLVALRMAKKAKTKYFKYKEQQTAILLDMFNMSHVEMMALMQLSRDKSQYSDVNKDIVKKLTEQTQNNIIKLGQYLSADKRDKCIDIGHIFPDLSHTEQDVCRLVLKGYTLKEIATAMNKSTSNISTVRGNIRKKLGLEKEDDLKSFLESAAGGY